MSAEFRIGTFANLSIEELQEAKEEFLSLCNGEIEAKTLQDEWCTLPTDDFLKKYPNSNLVWQSDTVSDKMSGEFGFEDPEPMYDTYNNYNWYALINKYPQGKN